MLVYGLTCGPMYVCCMRSPAPPRMSAACGAVVSKNDWGRLYIKVVGSIVCICLLVRLCGIVLGYLDLVGYWLLCGDMSVNGMVVLTHDQDVNRLVVLRFWYEYS